MRTETDLLAPIILLILFIQSKCLDDLQYPERILTTDSYAHSLRYSPIGPNRRRSEAAHHEHQNGFCAAIDAPKPTTTALYDLLKIMAPAQDFAQIDASWRLGVKGYAEYKRLLLDLFHANFDAARERRKQLLAAPDEVEHILVQGARRAREMAAPVISRVRRAVGLPESGT
jgi:hypothetical protein